MNCVVVLISAYFPYLYTEFIPSPEVRYWVGWAYCALNAIYIGINLIFLWLTGVLKIVEWRRKKIMKAAHQEAMKAREERLEKLEKSENDS